MPWMARSKWFPSLTSDTLQARAAAVVVRARAATVEFYLRRLGARPRKDPEDIHQLRVATRRLVAALSVFKPLLDPALRRSLRRCARRVRRVAGDVRDLDVQRMMFDSRRESLERHVAPNVVAAHRRALDTMARKALRKLVRTLPRASERFHRAATALIDTIGTRSRREQVTKLRTMADHITHARLDDLTAASRGDLGDLDKLHRLRIAAKRLRYAMELFGACYGREFRDDLYARVEALQESLGEINDLRNLAARITELGKTASHAHKQDRREVIREASRSLQAPLQRELDERRSKFLARWQLGDQDRLRRQFRHIQRKPALRRFPQPRGKPAVLGQAQHEL
jgi:CHAD domain-containing protein